MSVRHVFLQLRVIHKFWGAKKKNLDHLDIEPHIVIFLFDLVVPHRVDMQLSTRRRDKLLWPVKDFKTGVNAVKE